MKTPIRSAAWWLLLAAPLGALAHGSAHQHGVGKLDIAVDAKQIVVQFETPLDNLVGFERAPRTDSERQRAGEAVARLKDGETMFQFDPAAGCKLARVSVDSPPLGLGTRNNAAPARGEHADLFASWEFSCADAVKAAHVDVGLFAFKQLKRVQVQLALPKTQAKSELKRPKTRISLAP
jgi:Protein of unknown function (DUF2796)